MSELRRARTAIKDSGRSNGERNGEYYQDAIAKVRERMNEAKIAALKAAAEPFEVEMAALEEDYAMFLRLSS